MMSHIKINGVHFRPLIKRIAVDTGTSSIAAPTFEIGRINELLKVKDK